MAKGDKEKSAESVELGVELTAVRTQISVELNRLAGIMRELPTTTKNTHANQPKPSIKKAPPLADTAQLDRFNANDQVEILLTFDNCKSLEVKRFVVDYLIKELNGCSSGLGNDIYYAERAAKAGLTSAAINYKNNAREKELDTRVRILFLEHVATKCHDLLSSDAELLRSANNYLGKAKEGVRNAQTFFNPPPAPDKSLLDSISQCTVM